MQTWPTSWCYNCRFFSMRQITWYCRDDMFVRAKGAWPNLWDITSLIQEVNTSFIWELFINIQLNDPIAASRAFCHGESFFSCNSWSTGRGPSTELYKSWDATASWWCCCHRQQLGSGYYWRFGLRAKTKEAQEAPLRITYTPSNEQLLLQVIINTLEVLVISLDHIRQTDLYNSYN